MVEGSTVVRDSSLRNGKLQLRREARTDRVAAILDAAALETVARLHAELEPERRELLAARETRQRDYDGGALPGYLSPNDPVTRQATSDWRVASLPADLLTRRVEITGPVSDPKMVINMLSRTESGDRADAAMLDFEDSMKPSWENVVRGIENVRGAVDGTLSFVKPGKGGEPAKEYRIDPDDMPLLMVRVRGLHLDETNVTVDGAPVAAGLFDLTLSAWHTARRLMDRGKTPKYYVPKCEHHLEARWWNRLFSLAEEELTLPAGSLRATFLIETLPAAFQMEEILWELRERAAGLNVGRWDKIFSDIKVLREHPDRVLADRGSISLNRPWMKSYAMRLVRICHKHGAFGMGGMSAFTPGSTAQLREEQTQKVVEDKAFEASIGHDGCWVSHPYFIGPAMSAFSRTNQLDVIPDIDERPDLLPVGGEPRTLEGLRKNVRVGIAYMQGWNRDIGCVAWDDLMEDLATLEISRAQVWQWLRHEIALDDGTSVTPDLVRRIFDEESLQIELEVRAAMNGMGDDVEEQLRRFADAREDAEAIFTETAFRPFLTCRSDPAGMDLPSRRAQLRAEGTDLESRRAELRAEGTHTSGTQAPL
ncbi:MAG TPA: malate synthase A [Gemmatimonadota bacterium]|nr:malate synthase A [Gemmatimonadota bacterium]